MPEPMPVDLPALRWGAPGAGVRVLLVHGLTSSGAVWWRVSDGLAAAGCRVTAVDLRGHGQAPHTVGYRLADFAADLAGVPTEASAGDWDVVVGHSLGGAAVTVAAASGLIRARRLVLLDPVLDLAPEAIPRFVDAIQRELTDTAEQITVREPGWHPEDVRLKLAAAAATTPYVVEHCLLDNSPWHLLDLLAGIPAEVTVLGADPRREEPSFTPAHGAAHPEAGYRLVDGSGHSIHRDAPAQVIAAVLRA